MLLRELMPPSPSVIRPRTSNSSLVPSPKSNAACSSAAVGARQVTAHHAGLVDLHVSDDERVEVHLALVGIRDGGVQGLLQDRSAGALLERKEKFG